MNPEPHPEASSPEDFECPACGRFDFRDEQGRGGHLATVQDDTHRAYRETHGLTSAQDLARLLAPAPRPYNVPRLPTPRTQPPEPWPEPEAWREPVPRVVPEVVDAPRRGVVLLPPAPMPERGRTSPVAVALGILATVGLGILAFAVGRDPARTAPSQPGTGGPSWFEGGRWP
jgi:hypothetical protein